MSLSRLITRIRQMSSMVLPIPEAITSNTINALLESTDIVLGLSNTPTVITCPNHYGQPKSGVSRGVSYLYNHPYFQGYLQKYCPLYKYDSLKQHKSESNHESVSITSDQLCLMNQHHRNDSDLIINLLGDHSCAIGTVEASLRHDPNTVVIWIDAHADINTPLSTLTGNIHGMVLAYSTGLTNYSWQQFKLPLKNIIYYGVRDMDDFEACLLDEANVKILPTFNQIDWSNAIQLIDVIRHINGKNIHISFDVDSLDPSWFPATGTKVENGLSPSHVTNFLKLIKHFGNIITVDITEFNPEVNSEKDVTNTECVKIICDNVLRPILER